MESGRDQGKRSNLDRQKTVRGVPTTQDGGRPTGKNRGISGIGIQTEDPGGLRRDKIFGDLLGLGKRLRLPGSGC